MPELSDPSESIDPSLLQLGVDKTPTLDMVVKGKVGNGQRPSLASEIAATIQSERVELKRSAKIGRIEAYEQGVKDTLGRIGNFEDDLLSLGVALLEKLERGKPLTGAEVQTLRMVQGVTEDMKNRVLRKPTQEIQHNVSILGLIAGTVDLEQLDD